MQDDPVKKSATTVLVVDDNPMDQRMAGAFVEQVGMAVRYAEDGRQAMEMLNVEPADIVLTECSRISTCGNAKDYNWCAKSNVWIPRCRSFS